MADPTVFEITDGVLGLILVDTDASGYDDTWQAPGGATADTAVIGDYEAASGTWKCQVTRGVLTARPSTRTVTRKPTFCAAGAVTPNPDITSYTLEGNFYQDLNVAGGLSQFLFEHDTEEAYFFLGFDGTNPPKAIGRVRVAAGALGGDARTPLESTLTLPCSRKPSVEFGDSGTSEVV